MSFIPLTAEAMLPLEVKYPRIVQMRTPHVAPVGFASWTHTCVITVTSRSKNELITECHSVDGDWPEPTLKSVMWRMSCNSQLGHYA
jgi:hypothetical protein